MSEMYDLSLRANLLERARSLTPMLREAADEIDDARRLPGRIVRAMKDAGVFRMSMPKAWGGWEADPITQNLVIEEVSAANGSAGWCLMIGLSGGFLSSLLDQDVARKLLPDPNMTSANAFVPPGKAVRASGGYVVSGRWPFASGIHHSDWVQAVAIVHGEDGEPAAGANGRPMMRQFWASTSEVEIIDTWQTTGLKGTGSCDFAYNDLFIPEERCVDHAAGEWKREGPLYRSFVPGLLNHMGVPLGLGARALEAFGDAMRDKPAKFGAAPRDEASVQAPFANASALVASARAYAFQTLDRVWAQFVNDGRLSKEDRVAWRVANAHIHDSCAQAIQLLQHAAGSMAVYLPSDLDRCFRDIHTARQHGIVSARVYEQGGRAMLGGALQPGW